MMSPQRLFLSFAALSILCTSCTEDDDPIKDMSTDMSSKDMFVSVDMSKDLADTKADMKPVPLVANAGENKRGFVGQAIELSAQASSGALTYQWDFGDGQAWDSPKMQDTAQVTYNAPGRYQAVLTVFDAVGKKRTDALTITITNEPTHEPVTSSSLHRRRVAQSDIYGALSQDGGTLTLFGQTNDSEFKQIDRKSVCTQARHLTAIDDGWALTCPESDKVQLWLDNQTQVTEIALPYGSRPHGIITHRGKLYVTLQGKAQVAVIDPQSKTVLNTFDTLKDVRGISLLPDDIIIVTQWRSDNSVGAVELLDTSDSGKLVKHIPIPFDPRNASDTEHGGVPNYMESAVVDPTAKTVVLPALQANIKHGITFNNIPFSHDISVRAVLSFIDLENQTSTFESRYHFDSRGFASAAVFSPFGDDLYVAMRGSRMIERIDMLRMGESGTIFDVGFAPQALAMSPDGQYLFVDAALSRHVNIYDLTKPQPELVATISLVDTEPLPAHMLLGKQLFNDSFDLKITQEGYIACAHCHLDGESDLLTWDFTDRGEGLRNTTSLLGRTGAGHGPIHWSGNFDEIQDFEHDIREHFKGQGFLSDMDYVQTSPLGVPKAGKSAQLDALAAYVTGLDRYHRSPYRTATGQLTAAGQRGKTIFESAEAQCTTCHQGDKLTDSQFITPTQPLLHDVGTLKATSGQRLGGPLGGIDTPTLHGLYNSYPYLHDGSATSVKDVITTLNVDDKHGKTSHLSVTQIDDLTTYLLSLDGQRQ